MRVLLLGHSYVSVELAQAKARELARRPGLEVAAVAPARFFELGGWMEAERPSGTDYELHVLPAALTSVRGQRHAYFYPRGLGRVFRRFRPDVVDVWEEPYTAATAQMAVLAALLAPKAPFILTPSQMDVRRYPPPFGWWERWVVRQTDYAVGRSPEGVAVMRAKGYRGPSAVIGHGIELGLCQPMDRAACRRELGLPEDRPVVGYLGRLSREKGADLLVEAMPRLPEAVTFAIAGVDGGEEAALREQVRRLGLNGRVRFLGPVSMERVPVALNAMDVVAMPSREERFGRVAVEAMSCGVPLVATSAGHLPVLLDGLAPIVPPNDSAALAGAVAQLLDEAPEARAARVRRARDHAATFSWAALAERWHRVYDEALALPRGRRRR